MVGPVLAAQFGYLPGLLWIVIGVCLGGSGTMWATVYARVPDVDAALHQAESLGGKLAYGPVEPMQGLKTGAFHDLAGNPFGVYQSR